MKATSWFRSSVVVLLLTAVCPTFATPPTPADGSVELRGKMKRQLWQGNVKEAYEGFRRLALNPKDDPNHVGYDLDLALGCLLRLNHADEVDALLEDAVKIHCRNWRLLWSVARDYQCIPISTGYSSPRIPHHGYLIAGKFRRGDHRGGGRIVNAFERDRIRALQLMVQAMPLAMKDDNHAELADYLETFAQLLLLNRCDRQAWQLQTLSDLSVLPDYEEGWGWQWRDETRGAPVDADGRPVFYHVPKSFEAAGSDGERWWWCLQQAIEMDPKWRNEARMQLADFLRGQFGVETMVDRRFGRTTTDDIQQDESGPYAVHTLGEDETIARLATGVKRFSLPDEFNYIKIYQQIVEDALPLPDPSRRLDAAVATERLAQIFENRRQYPKAAAYWRQLLKEFPNEHPERRKGWQQRLDQIIGNWGRFEPNETQPAGRGATLEYRFRNGRQVEFTAQEINVEKLLADIKTYLKSSPKDLEWNKTNLGNIGYRLVEENQQQYVGQQVAQWQLAIEPRENHFDKRVTVTTPLQKPGAYLVRAKMSGGNTCFVVVWIDDTVVIGKRLADKSLYFVADAVTGQPVAKANLEFFGYQPTWHDNPPRREILTRTFAEQTDAEGQAIAEQPEMDRYQWLVTARTAEGRFAFLGFRGVWYNPGYDAEYNATKVYAITDRPVYRPEQKVHYKFWVRHAKYDMPNTSEFADYAFTVQVRNPKGDKVFSEVKRADAYGGIEGEYSIPADATLGVFQLLVIETDITNTTRCLGGGTFRVEEYKKPEFEVSVDAPTKPVMLGQKITATIRAKYYFGSPVTQAKVKYKVNRTSHDAQWYPVRPWDWFYGPGYWWFAGDYAWYAGWQTWGCLRPTPVWWRGGSQPPELVAEQELPIGPDGTVKVEIDTAPALAVHPDQDQRYTITAEVVDQSRRTIVGTGTVLVARRPFAVYAWLDRGYLRVGDTVAAHFAARTLDGKPVQGRGELRLLKISYKDGKPIETPVQTWPLDTNAEGEASQRLTASQAGQYRLSYKLKARGESVEGKDSAATSRSSTALSPLPSPLSPSAEAGYLFTIVGPGFDGSQFRFNHLELIPDKPEYRPGDVVKLQINTDRVGSTILLFLRPTNGVYLPPKLVHLDGKSTIEEIGVVERDMPNFFVEAVTVADGRVYTETREIVVPPEKRVLNVEIVPRKAVGSGQSAVGGGQKSEPQNPQISKSQNPPSKDFRPGEKARVTLKLTDFNGRPFVGSTVVAIYDKSLEYISGGSNVADIKEFFWKWRRRHSPQTESSLDRDCGNLVPPKTIGMGDIGAFGDGVDGESAGMGGLGAACMTACKPIHTMGYATASRGRIVGEDKAKSAEPGFEPGATDGRGFVVEPTVRTKFADTALWVGALQTAADGTAEVSLDMPENLTTWRIKVWGLGHGTRVCEGFCDVVTRKDLIVRLEAPRFFVQNDEVVISAIVHNYLKEEKTVRVALELDNKCVGALQSVWMDVSPGVRKATDAWTGAAPDAKSTEVLPNGEARVDWRVKVLDEGQAVIRVKALTDEESDAMEQRFPCYIHGMAKMDSFSGSIRPKDTVGRFTVTVPEKRRPGQSRLEVRWSPTLAGSMVDALPYMVNYPYGCTEQTLNRFLPTVITQKVLLDMKLDLKEIQQKRTNLDSGGQWTVGSRQSAVGGGHPLPSPLSSLPFKNPVFDQSEFRRMVKQGVERLTEMQCADGGWGWFSGWGEHSDPHTTALVVHGLQIARQNDVALAPGVMERGVEWLTRYQAEQVQLLKNAAVGQVGNLPSNVNTRQVDNLPHKEKLPHKDLADNLDAFVYMVLVDAGVKSPAMLEFLDRDRTHLAVYGLAMYGLALEKQLPSPSGRGAGGESSGLSDKLAMVLRNIGQYVERDDENQTAWLRLPEGSWWCWYGSEYEAHAYYLKLLARTDPKGELAPRIVKYLLNNRKHATYWNSTRDTALCIEAMADFIRRSGEDRPQIVVDVYLDGRRRKTVEITPQNLFTFDNRLVVEGEALSAGRHTVELRKRGAGSLYFNGYLSTFTLEDFIRRTGLEIKVNRKYYKLVETAKSMKAAGSRGQAVDQRVEKYERQELANDAQLKSGDLVEIELELDSKNDYEHLMFEDMKPAGFEPVDLRSGYTGNELGAYVEFRDNRVVFFARRLARGKHSVSYRMRAETPGRFSALPTRASAMYAPELKANSDEMKLGVKD
ncbi:MAG: MG2 domain-containing protein [Thermoguttaceae bacterium]